MVKISAMYNNIAPVHDTYVYFCCPIVGWNNTSSSKGVLFEVLGRELPINNIFEIIKLLWILLPPFTFIFTHV